MSENVNPQTKNTLTEPKLLEQNNPPVTMDNTHPCTLRRNDSP